MTALLGVAIRLALGGVFKGLSAASGPQERFTLRDYAKGFVKGLKVLLALLLGMAIGGGVLFVIGTIMHWLHPQ